MARKDSLVRLHQRLLAKRSALRKQLGDDGKNWQTPDRNGGDVGDVASDGASREIDSQLAALESRELSQVDRAIELIRDGRYGTCQQCELTIPIARLNAVPCTVLCLKCQQALEELGVAEDNDTDWSAAIQYEGRMNENEVTLGDIDTRS